MISTLVLGLAYLQPSNLTTSHCFHALIEISKELWVVNSEHISDFATFVKKDKLAIIESCLVLVIQSIASLRQGPASFGDRHNL